MDDPPSAGEIDVAASGPADPPSDNPYNYPDRPEAPELARPAMRRQRPELDDRRQRMLQIVALASAAGSGLAALADAPEAAQFAASLGQGVAEVRQGEQQAYADRLAAYYDALQEREAADVAATNEERMAEYEGDLDAWRQQVQRIDDEASDQRIAERQRAADQRQAERSQASDRRELERQAERHQQRMEEIRARNAGEGDAADLERIPLEQIDQELEELNTILEEGYPERNDRGEWVTQNLSPNERLAIMERREALRNARQRRIEQNPGEMSSRDAARISEILAQQRGTPFMRSQDGTEPTRTTEQGDTSAPRQALQMALQEGDPATIMDAAARALSAGAISQEQYDRLEYNFGQ